MQAVKELDARGWVCPLPVLRAQKMLRGMNPGEMLRVMMTDHDACRDFDLFAKDGGVVLIQKELKDNVWTVFLKKV